MRISRKQGAALAVLGLLLVGITGCGAKKGNQVLVITREPYEKVTYSTTTVERGDLEPVIELKLKVEDFEKINYSTKVDGLEVDTLYVSAGDKVKAGDVLVSFRSDELQETIDNYQEQKEQDQLLIDHYTKLMAINADNDYSTDIEMLQEDVRVAGLYIEEATERLENYSIVAKKAGTITYVSDYLEHGYIVQGNTMITEACGSDNYTAQTTDPYDFQVGEIFTAESGIASYDMKLIEIEDAEDSAGNAYRVLRFEPVSDMSAVSEQDTLQMKVQKPTIQDAVYVDSSAIRVVNGSYYVYLLDENGFRQAVEVQVGDVVDGYTIITDGLSGGEQVTLN